MRMTLDGTQVGGSSPGREVGPYACPYFEEIERIVDMRVWLGNAFGRPISQVMVFPDPEERTIRLLEIGDRDSVLLGRTCGEGKIPFSRGRRETSVISLCPSDWQRVLAGELSLPEGWSECQPYNSLPRSRRVD